jgi:hypothetical protein
VPLFQRLQLLRECWLANIEASRGATYAAFDSNGVESAQVLEIDRHPENLLNRIV